MRSGTAPALAYGLMPMNPYAGAPVLMRFNPLTMIVYMLINPVTA
jgi:hypothetical protein